MKKASLVIDQSTTSSKVFLIDEDGKILDRASLSHQKYYPQKGWAEHDAMELYQNMLDGCKSLVERHPECEFERVSITNQRETIVAWDDCTKEPVYRAIVWQCGRTYKRCQELIKEGYEPMIQKITGLKIDPYFSATKMEWILQNVDTDLDSLKFGTIDSWLIYKLTNGNAHATDHTNASRTLLYALDENDWNEELLQLFSIPASSLPKILPSDAIFGYTDLEGALHEPIPIQGIMGDSQAAFLAQLCQEEGDIKMTLGTGSSIMMYQKERIPQQSSLVNVLGYRLNDKLAYGIEGIVNCNAECLNWAKEDLGLFDSYDQIDDSLFEQEPSLLFVPALTGLSMPYWNAEARGAFLGLERRSSKKDLLAALIDGILFQLCDALDAFPKSLSALRVDGGLSKNETIMQRLADLSQKTVEVSLHEDLSAMGAWMAGSRKQTFEKETRSYWPEMSIEKRNRKMDRYHRAIDCSLMMATIDHEERKWKEWNTIADSA